ncbi:chymotrypsin-like elastase family member 1 [Spea bombifrons]|uniref:chymotrypsin-like elastase family member 1 n=1 Tax=Spea bombifrons TaxID=233779 RepID=UPI00234A5EF5|nr:chymotrypsin-like elastase family member 1 [Spea bombifrons]
MTPLLVLLISLVAGSYSLDHAVHNHRRTDKVIGGQEAARNHWKWQVSLQISYDYDPRYFYHLCGGTLISRNWVLTAAHCVDFTGVTYRAAFGEHNLFEFDGTEYFIGVDNIVVHELWDANNIGNGYDIALLHLKESAFDNGYVAIGRLASYKDVLPGGYTCYVTGWGVTQVGGGIPDRLQEAALGVVDHAVCSQPSWWGTEAKDSMICAGGDGVTSGCSGDSGGPLNCFRNGSWEVHGIASYGIVPFCSVFQKPTVFTRVSAFNEWIYRTLELHGGQ